MAQSASKLVVAASTTMRVDATADPAQSAASPYTSEYRSPLNRFHPTHTLWLATQHGEISVGSVASSNNVIHSSTELIGDRVKLVNSRTSAIDSHIRGLEALAQEFKDRVVSIAQEFEDLKESLSQCIHEVDALENDYFMALECIDEEQETSAEYFRRLEEAGV